jgi:hypothetical protein
MAKILTSKSAQFCIAAVVAVLFFLVMVYWGKAGDCKPHEIDGQCGLSTFVGFLYGAVGGIFILLASTIGILVTAARRRCNSE